MKSNFIDWKTHPVEKVRIFGRKQGEMKTLAGNTYEVYTYEGRTVQIHKDDGEIVIVIKDGSIEYVHPRDEERVRKMYNIAGQKTTGAEKARAIKDMIKNNGNGGRK